MEWWQFTIAIIGGAFAGAINTLAGNGSAITLTILIEILGLPGTYANATNRVGIFFQTSSGALNFYKNGKLNVGKYKHYIFWSVLGAIGGIWLATYVTDAQFTTVFKFLMLIMLAVILIKPKRWLRPTDMTFNLSPFIYVPMFLALGFYAGFIQMGMGVLFLICTVLIARIEIIEANALKLAVVGILTLVAVIMFQMNGLIHWKIGLVMAIGQTAGGWFTAEFASKYPRANIWAYRLLVVVVVLALVRLFGLGVGG